MIAQISTSPSRYAQGELPSATYFLDVSRGTRMDDIDFHISRSGKSVPSLSPFILYCDR